MTNQEIFDKVWAHAHKQREQALVNHCCKYRTPEGLSCFVGCLIPDDKYVPELEGKVANHPAVAQAAGLDFNIKDMVIDGDELRDKAVGHQISLANSLQMVHDNWTPESWTKYLTAVAAEYHLEVPHEA